MEDYATLHDHINYLHPSIDDMTILFLSQSFMYLLLASAYLQIEWHTPPLIPFSTINKEWISVKRSVKRSKAASHASPGP